MSNGRVVWSVAAVLALRFATARAPAAVPFPPPPAASQALPAAPDGQPAGVVSRHGALARALFGFEPEAVQSDAAGGGRYVVRGVRPGWRIGPEGPSLEIAGEPARAMRLSLIGADPGAPAEPSEPRPGVTNRFIGNDPSLWRIGTRRYGRVTYRDVRPGVSVTYYGRDGELEFDLIVEAGVAVGSVAFEIEGADRAALDANGDLLLLSGSHHVVVRRPRVFEETAGPPRPLSAAFTFRGRRLAFTIEPRTPGARLVIDPVLVYSTLLGGSSVDNMWRATVDPAGNVYVTGNTGSTDFPATAGAYDETLFANVNGDAFVAKLAPDGASLVWATFLGGVGQDNGRALAVDASDNVYVTGTTGALTNDFPTTPGAFDTTPDAFISAFVTKLAADGGSLVYSTYLGGSVDDYGVAITVTGAGEAIVLGITQSTDLPGTAGGFQPDSGGNFEGWIARMNASGSALTYASYLGGDSIDNPAAVALDPAAPGVVYVTGATYSTDFPTTPGAFDTTLGAAGAGAFVTKIDTTAAGAASLVWSTFLSGTGAGNAAGYALAADAEGAVLTGPAGTSDFPTTPGAYDRTSTGGDAFVTRIAPNGASLVWSTFLGGPSGIDYGSGIAVDAEGVVTVVGRADSTDFPTTADAISASLNGSSDAFVARLSPTGAALLSSTYFGGSEGEEAISVSVVAPDEVVVVGRVQNSTDFPTTPGAFDRTLEGFSDAFISRLEFVPPPPQPDLSLTKTADPDPATQGQPLAYTLLVVNDGSGEATGTAVTDPLPAGVSYVSGDPGCVHAAGTVTCSLGSVSATGGSATRSFTVVPGAAGVLVNTATASCNETDANPANNTSQAMTPVAATSHDLSATSTGSSITCQPPGKKQVCDIQGNPAFADNGAPYFSGHLDVTSTCKKVGTPNVGCKLKGTLDISSFNITGVPAHDVTAYLSTDGTADAGDVVIASAPTSALAELARKHKAVKIKYTHPKGQTYAGRFVLLKVDGLGVVAEPDESNNVIAIGPLP